VIDRIQKVFVAEWFDEECDRPLAERPFPQPGFRRCSHIDDRNLAFHLAERTLKIEAVHPRHADIEQRAIGVAKSSGFQKSFGGVEAYASIPYRAYDAADRTADSLVVIYRCDQRIAVV